MNVDVSKICDVNTRAFGGPTEALLVEALRRERLVILSLVAEQGDVIVGHILFSRIFIKTERIEIPALALAPMAVVPERQRTGIGSLLVREGLNRCRELEEGIVLVVGHPDYYPRFGFSHALTSNLRSPYQGEAVMGLELQPGALTGVSGGVRYPAAFDMKE